MKWNIFGIIMDLLIVITFGSRLYCHFFLDEPIPTFRVVLDFLFIIYMAGDLVHRINKIRK